MVGKKYKLSSIIFLNLIVSLINILNMFIITSMISASIIRAQKLESNAMLGPKCTLQPGNLQFIQLFHIFYLYKYK